MFHLPEEEAAIPLPFLRASQVSAPLGRTLSHHAAQAQQTAAQLLATGLTAWGRARPPIMAGRAHRAAKGVSGIAARGHSPGKEEAEPGRRLQALSAARRTERRKARGRGSEGEARCSTELRLSSAIVH